ncbi:MAG: diaminopimelate decarboxylase [Peptostreptococcaceae bacterium]|nr:diaminopimelate decarboxylase [Peptostreptococcaceae bacterium]
MYRDHEFLYEDRGELWVEDVRAKDLADRFGTPLYIYSEREICRRIAELRSVMERYGDVQAAYSSKAFSCIAMTQLVAREGLWLDIVSEGELRTAEKAGFDMEKVLFNGSNKSLKEIRYAIELGVGQIVVDATDELELIQQMSEGQKKITKVLLRIAPSISPRSHPYLATGEKGAKFGIPIDEEVIDFQIERAMAFSNIELLGFHFHIGSQIFEVMPYLMALDKMLALVERSREKFGFETKMLDLGGGYGIRYTNEERRGFAYYIEPMMEKIERFFKERKWQRPSILLELGRSIVGEAGLSLYTIGSVKEIPGLCTYASVDGGMFENIRPALYGAKYQAVATQKLDALYEREYQIAGSCCESGDILIRQAMLPELERGDLLAILSTGAYGYSMAGNYNKYPKPAVVLVSGVEAKIIVRRQSVDQLIENELFL